MCLLTVSDRASSGVYEDKSGPAMETILKGRGAVVVREVAHAAAAAAADDDDDDDGVPPLSPSPPLSSSSSSSGSSSSSSNINNVTDACIYDDRPSFQ